MKGRRMKYYKVTNCQDGSIPWIFDSPRLEKFKEFLQDQPHLIIEEITETEFNLKAAE